MGAPSLLGGAHSTPGTLGREEDPKEKGPSLLAPSCPHCRTRLLGGIALLAGGAQGREVVLLDAAPGELHLLERAALHPGVPGDGGLPDELDVEPAVAAAVFTDPRTQAQDGVVVRQVGPGADPGHELLGLLG